MVQNIVRSEKGACTAASLSTKTWALLGYDSNKTMFPFLCDMMGKIYVPKGYLKSNNFKENLNPDKLKS